jgi:hypothetical protein
MGNVKFGEEGSGGIYEKLKKTAVCAVPVKKP